jgi:hypothetical protein
VDAAAAWVRATAWADRPRPLLPYLKSTFNLSAKDACRAIALATALNANAAPADEEGAAREGCGTGEADAATSRNTITPADNFASETIVGGA